MSSRQSNIIALDKLLFLRVLGNSAQARERKGGETIIIWIHEGPFFGDGLPGYSLVKPNQLRHFGISVQDNPYDTKNEMSIRGIDSNENKFYLPLLSKGVDISFNTRTPLIWHLIRVYMSTLLIN